MASLSRIDSNTTHGWQVKLSRGARGVRSRLFSDSKHGGRWRSKLAAMQWLVEHETVARQSRRRGSAHPKARLNENLVRELRKGLKKGSLQIGSWAKKRRVSFSAVYRAAVGETWRHVR